MALISKKFIDTIQGNNSDITPIVLLGDLNEETKEYDILDLFSTRAVTVHKNHFTYDDVNAIQAKPILKNISSIKNSIDIEKRKLKINTFRFSVYNYYEHDSDHIIEYQQKARAGGKEYSDYLNQYIYDCKSCVLYVNPTLIHECGFYAIIKYRLYCRISLLLSNMI